MNVAVVDVGRTRSGSWSAARSPDGISAVARGKRVVGLGADVERNGAISAPKLAEAVECVAGFVDRGPRRRRGADRRRRRLARPAGAQRRPARARRSRGRQGSARACSRATRRPASRSRERSKAARQTGRSRSCDVGGGSTQIAVGTVDDGAAWLRSVDLGSLRLSARIPYGDPPTKDEHGRRSAPRRAPTVATLTPPLPGQALAVGGTARTLRKLVGRHARAGRAAARRCGSCARSRPRSSTERYDIDLWRARALPAGAAILAEIQSLLGVPLEVGRGGLREGARARAARPPAGRSGRRQVGLGPDVPAVDRQHPDRTLLRLAVPADELADHVAVRRQRGHAVEGGDQVERLVGSRSLRQLVALLEVEAKPLRGGLEASGRSAGTGSRPVGSRPGCSASRRAPSPACGPSCRAAASRRRRPMRRGRRRGRGGRATPSRAALGQRLEHADVAVVGEQSGRFPDREPACVVDLHRRLELAADRPHQPVADDLRPAGRVVVRDARRAPRSSSQRRPVSSSTSRSAHSSSLSPRSAFPFGSVQSSYLRAVDDDDLAPVGRSRTTTPPAARTTSAHQNAARAGLVERAPRVGERCARRLLARCAAARSAARRRARSCRRRERRARGCRVLGDAGVLVLADHVLHLLRAARRTCAPVLPSAGSASSAA